MEIKDEKLVINFFDNKKNITKDTIDRYTQSFKNFSKVIGMSMTSLIEESLDKQVSFLRTKEIINEQGKKETVQQLIEPNIEKSSLAKYLKKFYTHEKQRGLKDISIYNYINDVRALLHYYQVKLPKRIEVDIITTPKKLLTHRKIKRAVQLTKHTRNKAIITLKASSGIRSKDIRKLKIKDFLKAVDIKSINELLYCKENLAGNFEFEPSKTKRKGFACKTCNSPESTKYIIEYLNERMKDEILTPNSLLFVTFKDRKIMSRTTLIQMFKRLDELLYFDDLSYFKEQLYLGEITEEEYEEEINDISQFHAHALRAFFINTISGECRNLKVVAAMEGRKSPIDMDKYYTNLSREIILNHYTPMIPSLSFEETTVNIANDKTEEELEKVKNELAETKKAHELEKQKWKEEIREEIMAEVRDKILSKTGENIIV